MKTSLATLTAIALLTQACPRHGIKPQHHIKSLMALQNNCACPDGVETCECLEELQALQLDCDCPDGLETCDCDNEQLVQTECDCDWARDPDGPDNCDCADAQQALELECDCDQASCDCDESSPSASPVKKNLQWWIFGGNKKDEEEAEAEKDDKDESDKDANEEPETEEAEQAPEDTEPAGEKEKPKPKEEAPEGEDKSALQVTDVDDEVQPSDQFYEADHEPAAAVQEMADILHLPDLQAEIPSWNGDEEWEASTEPGTLGAEEDSNLVTLDSDKQTMEDGASSLLRAEYEFWKNDERRKV